MLLVQKVTGSVWHCHRDKHGKNMEHVMWKRKLVTSIPTNQACSPWPPFCCRPVTAMFLSSSHACEGLINCLLPSLNLQLPHGDVNDAIDTWFKHHDSSPLQKRIITAWDDLACWDSVNALLNTKNPWTHCQLLAAQEIHTAAWSEALPIANVGNLLSPDKLRIAIAFRTGDKIFKSTKCHSGKIVDELGLHDLHCAKTQATFLDIELLTPFSKGQWPALISLGVYFFAETFRSFFDETNWSLKHLSFVS